MRIIFSPFTKPFKGAKCVKNVKIAAKVLLHLWKCVRVQAE